MCLQNNVYGSIRFDCRDNHISKQQSRVLTVIKLLLLWLTLSKERKRFVVYLVFVIIYILMYIYNKTKTIFTYCEEQGKFINNC